MSGFYNQSDSIDEESTDGSGKGLRKQLEEVLAMNKRLVERLDGAERQKTATDLLKDKGIDPAVAELIPENVDPAKWIEERAHLFGITKGEQLEEAPAQTPGVVIAPDDPALAEEARALADIRDAAEQGQPASVTPELIEQMEAIDSEAEFLRFLSKQGANGG